MESESKAVAELVSQDIEISDRHYRHLLPARATLRQGMFDHGYRQGVESGDLDPKERTVAAIKRHGAAIAQECARDIFNSELHPEDAMHHREHEKNFADRQEAEVAARYAAAEVRELEVSVAQHENEGAPDSRKWWLLAIAAVAGFAVGFVITYHDFFFPFDDEVLAWGLSFAASLITGAAISVLILADTGESGSRATANWLGLAAGCLIAVAFCAIRVRDAQTSGEMAFAIGLMLFELGLVIGLEGVAAKLRKARAEHSERQALLIKSRASLAGARAHLDRCRNAVAELDTKVESDIAYVEERGVRNRNLRETEEGLIAAGLDGYNAAISANRGRLLGATTRKGSE